MPLEIIKNKDITEMDTDAIVNPANTDLRMGGGACGAIFRAAGPEELEEACQGLGPIETGQAAITPGFNLRAKYIIHTAGPIYEDYRPEEARELLKASYTNSLKLAQEEGLKSIAFPLISSGIYGYPKEEAKEVAIDTIEDFLQGGYDLEVKLIIFD